MEEIVPAAAKGKIGPEPLTTGYESGEHIKTGNKSINERADGLPTDRELIEIKP